MNKEYEENKRILYKIHDYDPKDQTKNVHHIIFKADHGSNRLENLSLLPKDYHAFIHQLLENIKRNN